MSEALESETHQAQESVTHQREAADPTSAMTIQQIVVQKEWPGAGLTALIPNWPGTTSDPPASPLDPPWLGTSLEYPSTPSIEIRRLIRKHYAVSTLEYNGQASYSSVSSLSGAGYVPICDPIPTDASGNPQVLSGSQTHWNWGFLNSPLAPTGGGSAPPHGDTFTTYTWDSFTGTIPESDDFPVQTMTTTLSGEVTFASQLEILLANLLVRTWADADANPSTQVFNYRFNEFQAFTGGAGDYDASGTSDPDSFDMSPVNDPDVFGPLREIWIYANDGDPTTNNRYLYSGWYHRSGDLRIDLITDASRGGETIRGVRTRFKSAKRQQYFICSARIINVGDGSLAYEPVLTDVTLSEGGMLFRGQVKEIGLPALADIGDMDQDFVETDGNLSQGWIRFVILDEGTDTWSARTGIPIAGG